MKIAIGVNAIKDEAVTAGTGGVDAVTAIDDGSLCIELINQELVPFLGIIIVAIKDIALFIVLKIAFKRHQSSYLGGTAAATVTHIHRDAHVRHQLGNGITRLGTAVIIIAVKHQVPTIERLTEVHTEISGGHIVHVAIVGMASCAHIGPLVIVHHLGNTCRHTSRHGAVGNAGGRGIGGTLVIIRTALIPLSRQQGSHSRGALDRMMGSNLVMCLQILDLPVHLA